MHNHKITSSPLTITNIHIYIYIIVNIKESQLSFANFSPGLISHATEDDELVMQDGGRMGSHVDLRP